MDRTDAITLLSAQCASGTYPTLDNTQLGALIDATEEYTVWAVGEPYAFGAVVQPVTPNGHLYRCILAGTSGATEPRWALYSTSDTRPGLTRPYWDSWGWLASMPGSENSDGTCLWVEHAIDDGSGPYDVRLATYKAWLMKASLTSADYDFGSDQASYKRSQVIQNCQRQAAYWCPTGAY